MSKPGPKPKCELHVVLSDFHVPYHDPVAVGLALDFLRRHQPSEVHLLGDVVDFYDLSDHLRDPKRESNLQDDIDQTGRLLSDIQNAAPDAFLQWSEGNHEDRLNRYIWRGPKELSQLRDLQLPHLFEFGDRGISWHRAEAPYRIARGKLTLTHGTIIRKHSAYTAKAMLEKVGGSVIVGHTHRLGTHYISDWNRQVVSAENGCLCRLDPCVGNAFTKGPPNWQQGFTAIWIMGNKFQLVQVRIHKGVLLDPLDGKRYG